MAPDSHFAGRIERHSAGKIDHIEFQLTATHDVLEILGIPTGRR
jgi:hypothetical protein